MSEAPIEEQYDSSPGSQTPEPSKNKEHDSSEEGPVDTIVDTGIPLFTSINTMPGQTLPGLQACQAFCGSRSEDISSKRKDDWTAEMRPSDDGSFLTTCEHAPERGDKLHADLGVECRTWKDGSQTATLYLITDKGRWIPKACFNSESETGQQITYPGTGKPMPGWTVDTSVFDFEPDAVGSMPRLGDWPGAESGQEAADGAHLVIQKQELPDKEGE